MTQYLNDKKNQRREEKLRAEALLEEILKSVQNIESVLTDRSITVSGMKDFTSYINPDAVGLMQSIQVADSSTVPSSFEESKHNEVAVRDLAHSQSKQFSLRQFENKDKGEI